MACWAAVLFDGNLGTCSSRDWSDIEFGISEGVDFIAVSFVNDAAAIKHLKDHLFAKNKFMKVLAKIESLESLRKLEEIVEASDGIMVARGDLGVEIPLEQVPTVQEEIINLCRLLNKPVIVASQLLESMIEYPTPTRAEVADVSEAVRQCADALMLSGESAMGSYGLKAISILRMASTRRELWSRVVNPQRFLPQLGVSLPDQIAEQICNCAGQMANNLEVDAIFVYTKHGEMASLLSRNRSNPPIFAFTNESSTRITDYSRTGRFLCLWQVNYFADCSLEIFDDPSVNAMIEVGLLYVQRDPSFFRPISRAIQRCLVRWLVQERLQMSFKNSLLFQWHRVVRGRSYRHIMLQVGNK